MRLMSFETQLQSLLTEVDCTDDVIEDLQRAARTTREQPCAQADPGLRRGRGRAAIAAGAWQIADDPSQGSPTVAIVGGVASAGLGAAALIPKRHTVPYLHPHNLLAPVASGQDEERMYPTFVRRLIDTPVHAASPRRAKSCSTNFEKKIAKAYPESQRAQVRELLYGSGAVYDQR